MTTQWTVSRNSTILRDAIGTLWVTTAGTMGALGAAAMLSTDLLTSVVPIAVIAAACGLLYPPSIATLRAARRLPRSESPAIAAARKSLSRRFGMVVGVEVFFFVLANVILLLTHQYEYLVPVILLIVGVHFFPVAALFKMWPYYLAGALFSLASIGTLFATSSTMEIGRVKAWIALPTVSCAIVAWLTAGCLLIIQRKRLAQQVVE